MTCPDCAAELVSVDYRGIPVYSCRQCQGRWFEGDGLRQAKDLTDEDLRWLDFDPFGREADSHHVPAQGKTCPHCQNRMDALTYGESGVVIDRCLDCRGVWVHRGEFEKILQYLEQVVLRKTGPEYVKDSLRQLLEVATGKEDVADEIKDFLVVFKLSEVRLGVEHPKMVETIKRIYEYLPFL